MALLTIFFVFLITQVYASINRTNDSIDSIESIDDASDERIEEVEYYSEVNPAIFQFFIEYEDGRTSNNNVLMEEYLLSKDVLAEASEDTDINLNKIISESDNQISVGYNESGETKILGISKNENSNLFELTVNIGNQEKNMELAEYYYEYITSENIPFLADKTIYVLQEPTINEMEAVEGNIAQEESSGSRQENNEVNYLLVIFLSVIMASSLSLFIFGILKLFSKKLEYFFAYSVKEQDAFLLIDKDSNNINELVQLINSNGLGRTVIVRDKDRIEESLFNKIIDKNIESVLFDDYESILEISNPKAVDRLVYIIEDQNTNRNWYNRQRKLDEFIDAPTFIVQINNNY